MQDRRKFIKIAARASVLAGIAGLTGFLIFKEDNEGNNLCDFDFICQNCKNISSCELPEAEEHREKKNPIL